MACALFSPGSTKKTLGSDLVQGSQSTDLKPLLIRLAREHGFASCRMTPARTAPHADEFLNWLKEGNAGDMEWLGRNPDRRTNPELVLPGVQTIVVLAANYWQGNPTPSKNDGVFGKIARYAWGGDYHDWMLDRMLPLKQALAQAGGTQKCYVDTGPVLERDFAALAGTGWHGKSTMLINRRLGTWFFLGVILTTLKIDADQPETDHCGRCTRCVDACPTAAITAPHHVDARRCISYLTIENKGEIPEEFRKAIGDRIYGCDDCLDACPWNRFAEVSREAIFQSRRGTLGIRLREYLQLSEQEFRDLFRGSPILRIKRARFLRNVCVALGNVGDNDDLPALKVAESDPDSLISTHAQWATAQILLRTSPEEGLGCPEQTKVAGSH